MAQKRRFDEVSDSDSSISWDSSNEESDIESDADLSSESESSCSDVNIDSDTSESVDRTSSASSIDSYSNRLEHTLIQAAINNNKNEVRMCLRNGADANFVDYTGKTALLYAVMHNNKDLVRKLIAAGADVDATNYGGQTALMHLAKYGNKRKVISFPTSRRSYLRTRVIDYSGSENILSILINADANINKTDDDRKTALFYSLQNNNLTFAQALIRAGADVNETYSLGKTILTTAVENDNERLAFFLIKARADVNITDDFGKSSLIYSVLNDNNTLAVKLINAGADINTADKNGKTALMYFAQSGMTTSFNRPAYLPLRLMTGNIPASSRISRNNDLMDTLLTACPDFNARDNHGNTALILAAQGNNKSLACKLTTSGASLDATDNEGKTALIHSTKRRNDKISYKLVGAGADVNITDYEGNTALIYSVKTDNESLACKLIEAGADVNYVDASGRTALFYSAHNHEIAQELINAGADVNITDNQSASALIYSTNQHLTWSVSVTNFFVPALIKAGADVNKTDYQGKTALILAVQNNNNGLARKLIDAGASLDIADNQGKTALIHSVRQNKQRRRLNYALYFGSYFHHSHEDGDLTDMTCTLIKAGSDVNLADHRSKHALIYAVQSDNRRLSSDLIEAGSDVNLIDNEGKTALFYAVQNGNEGLTKLMITVGAKTDIIDDQGKTVLIYSSMYWNKSLALSLIMSGADVNVTDNDGRTALFYAASNENVSIVQYLLSAGANVNITDDEGKNVLFCGATSESIVNALIKHGIGKALINKRDRNGRCPLFYAITKSLASARCLLANGGNLHMRDNCNMNVLSYFIEHHMNSVNLFSPAVLSNGIKLFEEKGVQENVVFEAMINVAFIKVFPTTLWLQSKRASPYDMMHVFETLQLSKKFITYDRESERKNVIISRILKMKKQPHEYINNIPTIVELLLELGANPNYADADGNTAVHYVACLPAFLRATGYTMVMKILRQLERSGVSFCARNHQNETPLLFCLSKKIWVALPNVNQKLASMMTSIRVCKFLLEQGASVEETSTNGESVFHLIMKIFQQAFLLHDDKTRKDALSNLLKLLELFPRSKVTRAVTVNKRDCELNSPLHLWASLEYEKTFEGDDGAFEQNVIETIFKHFIACGAKLDDRNMKEKTPLHLCKTWTAVKLLIAAGANPNVVDSSGSSPMLVAAKNRTRKKTSYFCSDALQDPKTFWKSIFENNLDPWSVNRRGESVLSILIETEAFHLAKALLQAAILKKLTLQDTFVVSLLNIICKDKSTRAHWKSNLIELVLKSMKNPISMKENEETPLHICCRNIVRQQESSASLDLTKSSVHWTIATQLLSHGFKQDVPDSSGQTCLEITTKCPALKQLLMRPVDEVPLLIPWTSISKSHEKILEKVAKRQECVKIGDSYWYHQSHIQRGSFGFVFAGIYEKGGREVAIKRIEKLRMHRPEDKREITNLTKLADCEQVVRYLSFIEDEHFFYIVLELMEGNLNNYLSGTIDVEKSVMLCDDIVRGLRYLHEKNILHRDLKPSNILFKVYPKLCLKIADFGLSRSLDAVSTSTTVSGSAVGSRCWIAPEILKASNKGHSKSSDVYSCGLLLHYILSVKHHPFSPCDCADKSELQIANETENNMINNNMDGWDSSLCSEATDLTKSMLDTDDKKRPTAADVLTHPLFWSKKKKMDLLIAIGNQPEFKCPRTKRALPLTAVETDLEKNFSTIIKYSTWNDSAYANMPAIHAEMTMKRRSPYDTKSVVELVRFIRNTYAHVSEDKRPTFIRKLVLEDFVFLEHFSSLTMNVFSCARTHGWDSREEIKYALD